MYLCDLRLCQTQWRVGLSTGKPHRLKFGLPLGFIQEYYKNLKSKAVTIYTASTTFTHFDIQSILSLVSHTSRKQFNANNRTYMFLTMATLYLFKRLFAYLLVGEDNSMVCSVLRTQATMSATKTPSLLSHLNGTYFINMWQRKNSNYQYFFFPFWFVWIRISLGPWTLGNPLASSSQMQGFSQHTRLYMFNELHTCENTWGLSIVHFIFFSSEIQN